MGRRVIEEQVGFRKLCNDIRLRSYDGLPRTVAKRTGDVAYAGAPDGIDNVLIDITERMAKDA
jgi:hypothetical protein